MQILKKYKDNLHHSLVIIQRVINQGIKQSATLSRICIYSPDLHTFSNWPGLHNYISNLLSVQTYGICLTLGDHCGKAYVSINLDPLSSFPVHLQIFTSRIVAHTKSQDRSSIVNIHLDLLKKYTLNTMPAKYWKLSHEIRYISLWRHLNYNKKCCSIYKFLSSVVTMIGRSEDMIDLPILYMKWYIQVFYCLI